MQELEKTPMFMTHQPTPRELVENPQLAAMTQIFHEEYTAEGAARPTLQGRLLYFVRVGGARREVDWMNHLPAGQTLAS